MTHAGAMAFLGGHIASVCTLSNPAIDGFEVAAGLGFGFGLGVAGCSTLVQFDANC